MLTIVISKPKPLGGTDFSEYKDFINDAVKEGHTPQVISYLHGKVQSTMGYDIGLCLNGENCCQGQKYIEGIYDVQIMGYGNPCKAFLWNSGEIPRGLIVDATNDYDCAYAKKKFDKKERFL